MMMDISNMNQGNNSNLVNNNESLVASNTNTNTNTNNANTSIKKRKAWELKGLNNIEIDQMVGSGTFGVVFKGRDKTTGETIALKKIKIDTNSSQGFPITAIREIRILRSLKRHMNIVDLKEIIVHKEEDKESCSNEVMQLYDASGFVIGDIFMVFEYVHYDLSGLLKTRSVELSTLHIKSYMKQLLSGVYHLHVNKIMHRDLKPANILVTRDNVIKIADWGLARTFMDPSKQDFTNPVVTLWYRAPEVVLGSRKYGTEIDMWSLGCIFSELYTRVCPFRADKEAAQIDTIFRVCGTPSGELLEKYSKYPDWKVLMDTNTACYNARLRSKYESMGSKALNLLEKLLELDPSKRIDSSTALDEEYFWTINEGIPDPKDLKQLQLSAEPLTEHLVQKKQKEENEKEKQEKEKQNLLNEKKEREKQDRRNSKVNNTITSLKKGIRPQREQTKFKVLGTNLANVNVNTTTIGVSIEKDITTSKVDEVIEQSGISEKKET